MFYLDNGSPGIWDPNKGLPRQELGDIVVPNRPGINRRHLSNHSCRLKGATDTTDHRFDIFPLFYEAETSLKSNGGDDSKVYHWTQSSKSTPCPSNCLMQDITAIICKDFHGFDREYGELLGNWAAKSLMNRGSLTENVLGIGLFL